MDKQAVIREKLSEWNLSQYIEYFEAQQINYETFLRLDTSDHLESLIPKTGPRAKFKTRLKEFKESLNRQDDEGLMDINEVLIVPEEDSNKMSSEPSPQTLMTQEQQMLATQLFVLRHRLNATAQNDLMTVFKSILPYSINQSFTFNKIMVDKKEDTLGSFCLFSSLEDLLKDTLQSYGTTLLSKKDICTNEIKDIMNGEAYQTLSRHHKLSDDDITLLWNVDGVPVKQNSIWPLQFTINELPYQIRKRNVLVPGLWYGPNTENPDMMTYLRTFIDKCRDLAETPLKWTDGNGTVHFSRVFALLCSSDAVARPLLRNSKQFNGEYGCDWCLHSGTMVNKGAGKVRTYVYDEQKQKARCKDMFHIDASNAERSGNSVNGVKGFSVLKDLPNFDIVLGFVPEYSHAVLLGVTKQLVFLWIETENSSKQWYIGNKLDELDGHLLSLKGNIKTIRSPVSLKCREVWKAVDWQGFLLFYGLYVLKDYLAPEFLQHFYLLSSSIHLLLQDCISHDILINARTNLVRFVKGMAELYGEEHVTFNCHQLIHLCDSVQNWGPLWAISALDFENNNKDLQALLRDVVANPEAKPNDIAKKFHIWQNIPSHIRSSVFKDSDFEDLINSITSRPELNNTSYAPVGNVCDLTSDLSVNIAVENLLKRRVSTSAFECFTNGHTVYHCANSLVADKTKCTLKLKDGRYGEAQYFLTTSHQPFTVIVARMFDITPVFSELNVDQMAKTIFVKAKITKQLRAFSIDDIKCECVNVNGLIVSIPNTKEHY